jgi:preprotein translocase subunit SecF
MVKKGVSLKGGLTMTIPIAPGVDAANLQSVLESDFKGRDVSVRTVTERGVVKALIIEADTTEEEVVASLARAGLTLNKGDYSAELMGSSLGDSFFRQTIFALAIAFTAMAVVVFLTFRVPVPSGFVVLTAASDIISTLAVVSFLNIPLSTAGIAAILMLIGYSVDTDILLTNRVLRRREGTLFERTMGALKTGTTMSLTALVATTVGYLFSQSDVIQQIMLILMIGTVFDIIYTWIQNAGILRWYLEWKEQKAQRAHQG